MSQTWHKKNISTINKLTNTYVWINRVINERKKKFATDCLGITWETREANNCRTNHLLNSDSKNNNKKKSKKEKQVFNSTDTRAEVFYFNFESPTVLIAGCHRHILRLDTTHYLRISDTLFSASFFFCFVFFFSFDKKGERFDCLPKEYINAIF